jgi:hypothetical protein
VAPEKTFLNVWIILINKLTLALVVAVQVVHRVKREAGKSSAPAHIFSNSASRAKRGKRLNDMLPSRRVGRLKKRKHIARSNKSLFT